MCTCRKDCSGSHAVAPTSSEIPASKTGCISPWWQRWMLALQLGARLPDSSTLHWAYRRGRRVVLSRQRNVDKLVLIYNLKCIVFDRCRLLMLLKNLQKTWTFSCSCLSIGLRWLHLMLKLLELLTHTDRGSCFLRLPERVLNFWSFANEVLPSLEGLLIVVDMNRFKDNIHASISLLKSFVVKVEDWWLWSWACDHGIRWATGHTAFSFFHIQILLCLQDVNVLSLHLAALILYFHH